MIEFLRDHTEDHNQARWFIGCLHELLDEVVIKNEFLPGHSGKIRSATKLNGKHFLTVTTFEVLSRDRDFKYDTEFEIVELTEEEFCVVEADIMSGAK